MEASNDGTRPGVVGGGVRLLGKALAGKVTVLGRPVSNKYI